MWKYAMDCEMVASGYESVLARVSIVDEEKSVVLDTYVKPDVVITDYRTPFSGITPSDLEDAPSAHWVRWKVENILDDNLLIGHSLHFDLAALKLSHPMENIYDLAKVPTFQWANGQPISLKELALKYLDRRIQQGPHCSVEDATACMDMYLWVQSKLEPGYCVIL